MHQVAFNTGASLISHRFSKDTRYLAKVSANNQPAASKLRGGPLDNLVGKKVGVENYRVSSGGYPTRTSYPTVGYLKGFELSSPQPHIELEATPLTLDHEGGPMFHIGKRNIVVVNPLQK